MRGINLAADSKLPRHPDQSSHEPTNFFDGDNVSFVGRPFDLDDAYEHFRTLREWGFNTLRYIFTWEAIEAPGPSQYDEDWIQHTISVVKLARKYGFYVIMDPHQDVVRNAQILSVTIYADAASGPASLGAQERQCGHYMPAD